MKTFILVVLVALIATVYSDKAEMMFAKCKDDATLSCVGIKLITGNKPGLAGHTIQGSSSYRGICCKEGFEKTQKLSGFKDQMIDTDIDTVLKGNFDKVTAGKKKCGRYTWAL